MKERAKLDTWLSRVKTPGALAGKRLLAWHCLSSNHGFVHLVLEQIRRHEPLRAALEQGKYTGLIYYVSKHRGAPVETPPPAPKGVHYVGVDYDEPVRAITPGHDVTAKFCKIATPLLFPDAQASVCLDADLDVGEDLGLLDTLFDYAGRFGFIVTRHPAETWQGEPLTGPQRDAYRALPGMTHFIPLYVCGCVARGHAHPLSKELTAAWADEFLTRPTREQPTLCAAVCQSGCAPLAAPASLVSLAREKVRHNLRALFVHNPPEGRPIVPTPSGVKQLDEYFFFHPEQMRAKPVMMEIGAITPDRTAKFFDYYPGGQAVFVEPDPDNFKKLAGLIPSRGLVTLVNDALAAEDGPVTLYRFGHEQQHSTFPRHETEGMKLAGTVTVRGKRLRTLLDENQIAELDLLLLNCEGAELHALRELVADASLRARVRQICVGFHCEHVKTYPTAERDKLLAALDPLYTWQTGHANIPYYLFRRKA